MDFIHLFPFNPQLFKGTFFYCDGDGLDVSDIRNKSDCHERGPPYRWRNQKYNFDNLGNALMSLFVLASKDGWVNIMYQGLDAVAVDQQVRVCFFLFFFFWKLKLELY